MHNDRRSSGSNITERHRIQYHVQHPGTAGIGEALVAAFQFDVTEDVDAVIDRHDHHVAVTCETGAIEAGSRAAQFIHAPPCSQTMTGRFAFCVAERVNTFRNRQSSLTGSIFVYQAAIG